MRFWHQYFHRTHYCRGQNALIIHRIDMTQCSIRRKERCEMWIAAPHQYSWNFRRCAHIGWKMGDRGLRWKLLMFYIFFPVGRICIIRIGHIGHIHTNHYHSSSFPRRTHLLCFFFFFNFSDNIKSNDGFVFRNKKLLTCELVWN